MEVEPEHGSQDPATDVTHDDPDADNHYLDTGVRVLDLAERARELYLRQDEANRRRLLGFVLAECTLQAGRLRPTCRQPFGILPRMAIEAARSAILLRPAIVLLAR